jgi:hypothetical protein
VHTLIAQPEGCVTLLDGRDNGVHVTDLALTHGTNGQLNLLDRLDDTASLLDHHLGDRDRSGPDVEPNRARASHQLRPSVPVLGDTEDCRYAASVSGAIR